MEFLCRYSLRCRYERSQCPDFGTVRSMRKELTSVPRLRRFADCRLVLPHRHNIMHKTGFKTAQGLTFYALRDGLISLDDFR